MDGIADRFRGCLLGVACGDALGMPVEGHTALEIKETYGSVKDMMPAPESHFHYGLRAGQWTDDTELTLVLAESMIESSGFSGDRFAAGLIDWCRGWSIDASLDRGVGMATKQSLEVMRAGTPWTESGCSIPTCGSAMRSAPVGLVYHCDLSLVSMYADLQSISTHCSPAARAGAIAIAAGVALSLKGFPKETVLKVASDLSSRADIQFGERLLWAGSLSRSLASPLAGPIAGPEMGVEPDEALRAIGNSPEVYETVPAAFYCFMRFSPEEALIRAASAGGDTDSIASMVGALAGAANGTAWIPDRWLSVLEGRDRLVAVASGLMDLSARLCGP